MNFEIVPVSFGLLILFGFSAFGIQSMREQEGRAAIVALLIASFGAILFVAGILLHETGQAILSWTIVTCVVAGIGLYLLPVGRIERGNDEPSSQVDERDIMFARRRLVPGTLDYLSYYALRPEKKETDDQLRSLPGLLSPAAGKSHPLQFPSAQACFTLTEALREAVDGPIAPTTMRFEPEVITSYMKGLARYYGAKEVGVTELDPSHIYTHIGRGSGEYGARVVLKHRYAIAFTVEMDYDMMGPAPEAPEMMEAARQYSEAAQVAVQLAAMIRALGYPARAHIDGNYRVIAPLVARDAGLGEIGRMGLLMTRSLGPRIRLGVVTTDLPLKCDPRSDDTSVLDFCRVCKKCAENCPSKAISFDDRQKYEGSLRWRIDPVSCFRYWNIIGTDCGRCMAVCPYSHPDNFLHNVVRLAVRHSGAARRAALRMDDLFYGRRPAQRPAPEWATVDLP